MISGWLWPPEGYEGLLIARDMDSAQYVTWLRGFEQQFQIPNYHAPWLTDPALFNPLLWILAKVCQHTGLDPIIGLQLLRLAFYVAAAYALFFALRVFTQSDRQAFAALAVAACSVPLLSLTLLPMNLVTLGDWPLRTGLKEFSVWTADGFFHGLGSSALVTFGTFTTVLAFALLGKYLTTERTFYFVLAVATTFISALCHPFEFVVIVGGGAVGLVLARASAWRVSVPAAGILLAAGALGVLPYVYITSEHEWIQQAAGANTWEIGTPWALLKVLGLPTIVVLLLWLPRVRMAARTDILLQCWVAAVLIGVFLPFVPWSQHLLDGFHYAVGILLVRQAVQTRWLRQLSLRHAIWVRATVLALMLVSLTPHLVYRLWMFKHGRIEYTSVLPPRIAPIDELAAISWMRSHAQPDELVLAPGSSAFWLATVPMHSFASHFVFGLTFPEQRRMSEAFYRGELSEAQARDLLQGYGVRWVVAPDNSQSIEYLSDYQLRTSVGSFLIFENPSYSMSRLH